MNPRAAFPQISTAMNASVIGQETVVARLLIAFLADGHILMEGLPGVAKTGSIKTPGNLVESQCRRVQFTPDLLRKPGTLELPALTYVCGIPIRKRSNPKRCRP